MLRRSIVLNPLLKCVDEVLRRRVRLHDVLGGPFPRVLLCSKYVEVSELN